MSYPHTYSAGRVTDDLRGAHLGLKTDFNDALARLARTVNQIDTGASQIHAGAAGIRSAAPKAATSPERQLQGRIAGDTLYALPGREREAWGRAMPPSSCIAAPHA